MAYRFDKDDIVIDGWEKGIADDPYEGIADIRNVNINSVPKEAAVGFSTAPCTLPPTAYIGRTFTVNAGTDTFTTATTAGFYLGMAVVLTSAPVTSGIVNYLIVAAGGGGGATAVSGGGPMSAGGGGAGGLKTGTASAISPAVYPIVVGAKGLGGTGSSPTPGMATAGGNSVAFGVTSTGGGYGALVNLGNNSAGNGGSGGGASSDSGQTGNFGTGIAGQGFNGGNGAHGGNPAGAGGGGSSALGSDGVSSAGGKGGDGTSSSISGSPVTYAGGGGGGCNVTGGAGGAGGGGAGGSNGNNGTSATANSGGGGGGASANASNGPYSGGNGADGVVIISYPTAGTSMGGGTVILTATGGTITTAGGNTIHTFTTSGDFTVTSVTITSGTYVYYVKSFTATTFVLSSDLATINTFDVPANGSGTFTVPHLAQPFDSTTGFNTDSHLVSTGGQVTKMSFIVDSTGQAWYIGNGNTGYGMNVFQFLGNSGHSTLTSSGSLGICVFKNYLFLFIGDKIDYLPLGNNVFSSAGPNGQWVFGWKTITSSFQGHKAIAASDDAMYFCNSHTVGSIIQKPGTTFDPTNSATYTYNDAALTLPTFDYAKSLAQLGVTLLVGGIDTNIYPWDRISPSFSYPLIVPEPFIKNIVSTNSNAYIFAGNRGQIYITNGSNIDEYKKFPDQLTNTELPYYTWGDALYVKNQLYFGISATTNAGVSVDNFAGVWAIDLDTKALTLRNSLSYGSYAGSVPVIMPMGNINALGNAIYTGWINGSNEGGVDYSSSAPYTNYESYIDTEMIPVGLYYSQYTFGNVEYKLAKPLVTGESIRIAYRKNLTDSFTTITTFTTTGLISDSSSSVNFEDAQWVQLRISMLSTVTTPSYNRLREVRLR